MLVHTSKSKTKAKPVENPDLFPTNTLNLLFYKGIKIKQGNCAKRLGRPQFLLLDARTPQ
jgi:hypothetical protein